MARLGELTASAELRCWTVRGGLGQRDEQIHVSFIYRHSYPRAMLTTQSESSPSMCVHALLSAEVGAR